MLIKDIIQAASHFFSNVFCCCELVVLKHNFFRVNIIFLMIKFFFSSKQSEASDISALPA